MRARRRLLALAAGLLVLGAAAGASAQNAEALKHFERGKQLRDEDRCKEAIPELQKSLSIEKSIGGYYNLGLCSDILTEPRWQGQPDVPPKLVLKRQAFEAYRAAEKLAAERNDDRLREIGAQIVSFLRASPHLRLAIADPPPGLRITVDGEPVPTSDYARETYVFTKSGGTHVIRATAPGYEPLEVMTASAEPIPVVLQKPPPPPEEATPRGGWTPKHYTAVALVGAGAIVAGVFAYAMIEHSNDVKNLEDRWSGAREACKQNTPGQPPKTDAEKQACEDQAVLDGNREIGDANDTARLRGLTLGGIAAALLVTGAVVWLTAPPLSGEKKGDEPRTGSVRLVPVFGFGHQGLVLSGTF